jgi:hypothetical protein
VGRDYHAARDRRTLIDEPFDWELVDDAQLLMWLEDATPLTP